MKKILLWIAILIGNMSVFAQTANRSGVFVDFQVGNTFGYVYQTDPESPIHEFGKGGLDLGLGIGYREPIGLNWTFQGKAGILLNPSFSKSMGLVGLLGGRWNSYNFSNSISMYAALNTGIGANVLSESIGFFIPIDFEVGINITDHLGIGIFIMPKIMINEGYYDVTLYPRPLPEGTSYWDSYGYSPEKWNLKSNFICGVRAGWRF